MASRAQKRPGFASLSGANNSRHTWGTEKPKSPKAGDTHFDNTRFVISVYNGTTWNDMYLIYVSDTEPTNTNVLWYDTSI